MAIEKTELLTRIFYNSYRKSSNKLCKRRLSSKTSELEEIITDLSLGFASNNDGYLIIKQTEDCGLLKILIGEVLEKYRQIIELDGDSICILTLNEKEGIYIDYFEENNNLESLYFYEICYWIL